MEVLERLTPYVELVHLLLNTNFTYLTRKLAPSDSLDRARIPSAVAKSYDEVLFGGVLFDCVPGIPCEIKTPFGICFTALALWKGDGFVLIGPYLPERADGAQLEEILASQGVPLGLKEQYGVYYRDLPTLSRGKVRAALGVLAAGVYGESLASSAFSSRDISPEDPSPCPVFEEDSMQVRADAIARRYEGERRLIEAVARGDMRAAARLWRPRRCIRFISTQSAPNGPCASRRWSRRPTFIPCGGRSWRITVVWRRRVPWPAIPPMCEACSLMCNSIWPRAFRWRPLPGSWV